LFEVAQVDVAQQPIEGVGVRQGLDLGEQQMQVGDELRTGHFAIGLAPGGAQVLAQRRRGRLSTRVRDIGLVATNSAEGRCGRAS